MKHIIHVHQQKIRKNEPAIIDRTYKGSTHHSQLAIVCECGKKAATVIHSPQPDSCGARVWIEATNTEVVE